MVRRSLGEFALSVNEGSISKNIDSALAEISTIKDMRVQRSIVSGLLDGRIRRTEKGNELSFNARDELDKQQKQVLSAIGILAQNHDGKFQVNKDLRSGYNMALQGKISNIRNTKLKEALARIDLKLAGAADMTFLRKSAQSSCCCFLFFSSLVVWQILSNMGTTQQPVQSL